MAGTVGDELDKVIVDDVEVALEQLLVFGFLAHDAGNDGNDLLDDVDVALLVKAADVIDLADGALTQHQVDALAVVLDVEPVTHVFALAIDGQFLALKDVFDNQGNQLLGEVEGTVVVAAAGDVDGQTVGLVIGHGDEVGAGLAGRIGRTRCQRRLLGEEMASVGLEVGAALDHLAHVVAHLERMRLVIVLAERAIDLVGRNLQVFLARGIGVAALGVLAGKPGLAGTVEHILGAQDVGLEEQARIGDAAVHMALGSKVDDIVHIVVLQDVLHQLTVAHVAADEGHVGTLDFLLDGCQVAGIGQGVENDDLDVVAILVKDVFHKV